MVPIGSYIQMLIYLGVELFEGIRRIRRCGLVRESVSLGAGFEVRIPWQVQSFPLSADQDAVLSYCSSAMSAAMPLPCPCHDDNGLTL